MIPINEMAAFCKKKGFIYPSAEIVGKFEFYTYGNAQSGDEFWFDEFRVMEAEAGETPAPPVNFRVIEITD